MNRGANFMNQNPKVSVWMTTYYHGKYIKQAIESVLSQVTKFDIEICISDDNSLDETIEILHEYEDKYSFIKVNYNSKNIGLSSNVLKAKMMCSGDYIVHLSGDDYYIDNYKLQKQFDFLEKNKEYLAVCCVVESRYDDETTSRTRFPRKKYLNREITLEEYLKGRDFPTSGMMMRNILHNEDNEKYFSQMPQISRDIDDLTDCILYLLIKQNTKK